MNVVPAVSGLASRFSGRPSIPMTRADGYALDHAERYMWCSISGAARYATLPPSSSMVERTSGVRAVGEKTARAPELRRTVLIW